MKKLLLSLLVIIITTPIFAQFGYKNKLDPIDGIEISYKIVHEKFFDKSSPAQLRLKLKNTNDYNVNVKFEIEYQFDLTKSYNSGEIEIDIPKKAAKTGKMHGLVFEINSNDTKVFESENASWEFIIFEVLKEE